MGNDNKCLSENDKSNEDSDNEDEKENVVEIDERNANGGDSAAIKNNITEDKKKKSN